MRYRLLGRTGLRIAELCLGAMVFGDERGSWGADRDEAAAILETYAEAGGNFIDTANNYAGGESERILGELIRAERDRWVLASKYTVNQRAGDPNAGGNHRKSLLASLEGSLRRLGTDYLDLYYVHVWDRLTPVEEVVRSLEDVVRAGKVRYVGISDTPAWLVAEAVTLADLRGWERFAAVQVPYSLVTRDVERELLPMARALELTVMAWAPLGGGLLTGRYGSTTDRPADTRLAEIGGAHEEQSTSPRKLRVSDVVNEIAEARGLPATQIAIAWVAAQQARAVVVPIVGVRTRAQLADNLAAVEIELSAEELDRLDAAGAIELGFPHDFGGRQLAYGGTANRIVNHRDPGAPL
ncbi:MAG: aldo/keto reductase [Actinobacteria bacterium]|nr:aldo/keto reductase [Actinomycetota bacterium]